MQDTHASKLAVSGAAEPDLAPVGIEATAYHVPEPALTVEDWCRRYGHPPEKAASIRKHGGAMVHIADEPLEQLVYRAVERLSDAGYLKPTEIGLVLYAHTTQISVPKPPRNMSGLVMRRFGLNRAFGCSISEQNCVSVYMAIRIGRAMLLRRPELGSALIVAGDVIPNENYRESDGVGLNSDGASALILRPYPSRNRILDMATHTECAFADRIFSDDDAQRKLKGTQALYLSAERMIQDLLAAHELTLDEIPVILPHNLNLSMWRSLIRFLRGKTEQLYTANFDSKGHALCNDLIINLTDIDADPSVRLAPNDPVLCFTRGYGWTYGTMLLRR